VLAPDKINVPAPDLVNATVPPVTALSLTIPEKVVEVPSLPAVKVDVVDVDEFNTVPAPANEPIVSENEAKSNVPVSVTAEPFGITSDAPSVKVPEVIVVVPEYALLVLDKINGDVPFSIRFVTPEPMVALIKVLPLPEPEFVIVPVLLIEVVESVMLLFVELLLLRVKLPVPVIPPVTVKELAPLSSVKVVPEELTAIALIDNAEVVLLCLICATLEPTPLEIVVTPDPAPV